MEKEFRPDREERLESLREEALRTGRVNGVGQAVVAGPLPAGDAGYHGHSFLKAPVWKYYIPLYFFVGGLAGMSGVLGFSSWAVSAGRTLTAAALAVALGGAIASVVLLTLDLGRPLRFIYMLRVFKWRSPMSVGSWLLASFGGVTTLALALVWFGAGRVATGFFVVPTALLGALVATYTGVLIGATAIPAWMSHHRFLPLHFGIAGIGCSAALLEILGFRERSLTVLVLAAAAAETLLAIWQEVVRKTPADRAIRTGKAGGLLWPARAIAGPAALAFALLGWTLPAAWAFLVGIFLNRWGWSFAGKESAREPDAAFAAHGGDPA